jgi:hypothetical protein
VPATCVVGVFAELHDSLIAAVVPSHFKYYF